jgi:RND family efflux transporter MFP subunit
MLNFFVNSTLLAQSNSKNANKRASLVEVQKVSLINIAETTETIGRLVALDPIIISAKINQEVLKVHFLIGDNIKKNDLLITLESKDILRNIKQISSELLFENQLVDLLKKQLELRLSKEKNALNLKNKKIITQDNLDTISIVVLQNQQQIAQREYNIKKLKILLGKARDDLTNAKVLSPINGNIILLDIKKGGLIQKGKVIASILAEGSKEIETDLRAESAARVILGSKVIISNNQYSFNGKIRGIVNTENIRTGTRKVRVALNKALPKRLNVTGTRFSLKIPVGKSSPRLLIHKDALISKGQKQIVYIFDKGLAKQNFVKIGLSIGNKIEIIDGIKEGQLVVIKGNENLRPNQSIKIKKKNKSYKKNQKKN